jgi:hypothetical protein
LDAPPSKDVSKAASTSFVRFWSSAVGRRGSRQNAICGIYTMRVGARRQPLGEAVTYGALGAR